MANVKRYSLTKEEVTHIASLDYVARMLNDGIKKTCEGAIAQRLGIKHEADEQVEWSLDREKAEIVVSITKQKDLYEPKAKAAKV